MFDAAKYDDNYVMHCPEMWMAKIFCQYLHEHGWCWSGGSSYLNHISWNRHKKNTCYKFNTGTYGSLSYFQQVSPFSNAYEGDYHILEFEDFDWSAYEKPVFRAADYTGDYVMHCPNRFEASKFYKALCGDGAKVKDFLERWGEHRATKLYDFNRDLFVREGSYQVLRYEDFEWDCHYKEKIISVDDNAFNQFLFGEKEVL